MDEIICWLEKNERKIWLFIGAILFAVAVENVLIMSAVYLLGLAIIPKEG